MTNETPGEFSVEPIDPLEALERKRAKRREDSEKAWKTQRLLDLAAIDDLEVEHGETNVTVLDLPWTPGLPTCIAARTPKPPELQRYRDGLKPSRRNESPDTVAAAELLADVTRVYPPRTPEGTELFARIVEMRPGCKVQLGVAAVSLATASAEAKGKG